MLNHPRLSLLAGTACILAAFLPTPCAHADSLMWGSSGYTYNAATQVGAAGSANANNKGGVVTTVNAGTANANTISILYDTGSYFSTAGGTTQPSPAVGTYVAGSTTTYTDGGTTAASTNGVGSKALQIIANFDNAGNLVANAGISVTVFFSKPVSNLLFSFWDVDNGTIANNGPYNDLITNISALNTSGTKIRPTSLTPGTANTSANGVDSGSFTASANNAQNAAGGNAGVSFNGATITQFTFTYGDSLTAGAAHSNLQIIALSDLTFTTVPEPSTWATVGVAGIVGAWTLRRRARRTA